MNKLLKAGLLLFLACIGTVQAQQKQDTIVVARMEPVNIVLFKKR